MKLISLHLKQWRSYEDCRIEFPDGLVGVRGPNGAGKSTLAEAVGWALFGKLRARAKVGDLRRQGAPRGARPSVELVFQLGSSLYRIERIVGGDARLWINDALESTKARDTNFRIAQEIGVTKEVFWRTVFAEQKDVAALDPHAGAEARKSHVERLLGLEKYKQAAARARGDAKTLKSEIDGLRELAPDLDAIRSDLETAEREATAADPAVKKAEAACAKADKERKRLAAAVDAERDRARHAETAATLSKRIAEFASEIKMRSASEKQLARIAPKLGGLSTAQRTLDLWDEVKEAGGEVAAAEAGAKAVAFDPKATKRREQRLAAARSELDKLRSAHAKRVAAATRASERLAALRGVADTGESAVHAERLKLARKREQALAKDIAVRESQLERDRAHLTEVEGGGPDTPCSVCGKPYGKDYERLVRSYRDQIAKAERELPKLETERVRWERSCDAAEEALTAARHAEDVLTRTTGADDVLSAERDEKAAQSTLADNESRTTELLHEVTTIADELAGTDELEEEWRTFESDRKSAGKRLVKALEELSVRTYSKQKHEIARARVDELQDLAEEAAQLRAEIKALSGVEKRLKTEEQARIEAEAKAAEASALLEQLGEKPGSLDRLKQRFERAEAARDETRERLNEARLAAQERSHEVKRLKSERKKAEGANAEIAARVDSMRIHEVAADLLSRYRDAQARRAWPRLESGTSALLAATTDGRYADVELSDDYRLMIVDRGEKHELARFSGGEQDLANLCLRLAIADWVALDRNAELGFVVLDEVFGSQDDERRQRLLGELRGLAERFRQVLVITHLPDIADLCDSQLEVTVVDDGTSTAVLR